MKKGMILEIKDGKADILKNNGEFICVKAEKEWKKGDIVTITSKKLPVKAIYAAAACLLLLLLIGGSYPLYFTQSAIISIDVNPSIELSINRFGHVIENRRMNAEGDEILDEAGIRYKDYKKALTEILEQEKKRGYFESGTDLVYTVYTKDEEKEAKMLDALKQLTEELVLTEYGALNTEYHAVDEDIISNAHHLEVTAGKYLYLEELREVSPDIEISEYCNDSIEQIKDHISSCEQAHGSRSSYDIYKKEPEAGVLPQDEPEEEDPAQDWEEYNHHGCHGGH